MAVADVSTGHQHAVGSLPQRADNKYGINPSRAHDPNGSQAGWILQPGNAGQIRTGVRTPVAKKRNNFRFKIGHIFTIIGFQDVGCQDSATAVFRSDTRNLAWRLYKNTYEKNDEATRGASGFQKYSIFNSQWSISDYPTEHTAAMIC
jgi:hypothetical protein